MKETELLSRNRREGMFFLPSQLSKNIDRFPSGHISARNISSSMPGILVPEQRQVVFDPMNSKLSVNVK